MAHLRKHAYREGSPGAKRAAANITLTSIKRQIRQSADPTGARRDFAAQGLLGARPHVVARR